MDNLEIDVKRFLSRLRKKLPPFKCPLIACSKVCKSFSAFQKHMLLTHKNTKKIEICDVDIVNDENIDYRTTINDEIKLHKTVQPTSKMLSDTVQLSFADSKRFVMLQSTQRSFRCNVNVPIYLSMELNKGEISEINTNTVVVDDNSQDTLHSELSSQNRKLFKRRHSLPLKSSRKFCKLNNGNKVQCNPINNINCQGSEGNTTPQPVFKFDCEWKSFNKKVPNEIDGYVHFIEKSVEELDELVEYDLDEEDMLWLPLCNEYLASLDSKSKDKKHSRRVSLKSKEPIISHAVMEYVMDRFEKECHIQLLSDDNTQNIDDDDAVCDVCLDGSCENSNVILFCDMCNLPVHQDCYGVPYVPEGQWHCRKCLHSPHHPVDCCLCPNKGGAFKQTTDGQWAHVLCALWLPEVKFANLIFLEPIEHIDKVPLTRRRLTCYLCKQKNAGASIQCHKNNCYTAFHISCAQRAGLYLKIEPSDKSGGPDGIRKSAFCEVHTPSGYVGSTHRGMYATSDDEVSQDKSFKKQRKTKNIRKSSRTHREIIPSISYPVIPPEKITEISSKLDIKHKEEFLKRIFIYWKLKRECKRGVPLLRRLVASPSNTIFQKIPSEEDNNKMISKLKFWQQLRHDLEKARLLSELTRKREKLKREIFRNFVSINELMLHPTMDLMTLLIDQLQILDKGKWFSDSSPNNTKNIQYAMDFGVMRTKLKAFQYTNVDQVRADFNLMIHKYQKFNGNNIVISNAVKTIFSKSQSIFTEFEKQYDDYGFDRESGLFANSGIYDVVINSDDGDDIVSKLESEVIRKVELNKVQLTANERKLTKKSFDSHKQDNDESYSIKTRRHSHDVNSSKNEIISHMRELYVSIEEIGDFQHSSKKMPAISSTTVNTVSSSTLKQRINSATRATPHNANVSSTYRDPDSTCDNVIQTRSNHGNHNSFDTLDLDQVGGDSYESNYRFESLDLVWAKCNGSSWFPGLIVDPYMNRDGICDNKIPIPAPPENVLELGRSRGFHQKYLILFFDKRRTWQWLGKDKLKPFAIRKETDQQILQRIKKSKRNKTIQRAYREAVKHICEVNMVSYPYENLDSGDDITCPFIATNHI